MGSQQWLGSAGIHINKYRASTQPGQRRLPGHGLEMTPNNEATKSKIVDTSQKIQEVLLLLLGDNDDLRQRLDQEVADRKRETGELRDRLEKETGQLKADRDRLQ